MGCKDLRRTYPGGTAQGARVEVKPLRHAGSTVQGARPQKPRSREDGKEAQRGDEEVEDEEEEVGNEEEEVRDAKEDETKGNWGNDEENKYGGSERTMTTEEKTEIGDGQQGAPMWTSHPEDTEGDHTKEPATFQGERGSTVRATSWGEGREVKDKKSHKSGEH
ncbi:hypothetical protein NDU88_001939 [Pleurodeles waltl]|uniref:Uncharacterized protein n=1 Tax=Pleurodeles waltl TaxID=8319 RepID=A0AAV7PDY1_PLEWA|nr:hypothetical protein NDU88_001939 [Pleurodeles waltl]